MMVSKTSGKYEIFIVDDHKILREGVKELIDSEFDLNVCGEAGEVSGALEGINDSGPDLVLVDLSLRGGSGLRLIEELKSSRPSIQTLVLSMHDEAVYAERCIKAGARGYIMKDEPSEKLLTAIRKVIDGQLYVSSDLGTKLINSIVSGRSDSDNPKMMLEKFTNRELEVFQLIGSGMKKAEIAEKLCLSVRTIETYYEKIKRKLELKDVHEVIVHAVRYMANI